MKRVKFNKKSLFIFILILGIGTTLAYFTSNISIPNIFNSARYETTTTEEFTSPNNWKPGDTTPKTVVTTNNSNLPIRVRISVEESWTDKNNNNLSLEENGTLAAILDLDNRPDWIYEDGYYYYRYDVAPRESTNSFIKSVTFNKDIVGEYICTTENNIEQCDSASDTYQDANYKLNIKVETTQADNYLDAWGLSRAPRRVAPTYCTYEGELVQGAEYVNGQYTYKYMQQKKIGSEWEDMEDVGWGVALTDRTSTDPVTTPLCTYINDVPVISAAFMLYGSKATSIDTSSFDTSEIKNMNYMLSGLRNINELDVSNFDTSNVTDMSYMFYSNASAELDLSGFDTNKVTNMRWMFASCKAKKIDLQSFDLSSLEDMASMFYMSKSEKIILDNLDMSHVTNMSGMFRSCKASTISLKNVDTSNVTNMYSVFANVEASTLDLSDFDTDNATVMEDMFSGNKSKTIDLSNFNTSNVTNMKRMFVDSQVTSLDLSSFDTSNVTDMSQMFARAQATTYNLTSFDTSNVIDMSFMFYNNQATNLDLRNFNTSKVNNMKSMFYETQLSSVNLSSFDTANVTDMSSMFAYSSNISEIVGIEDFDTSRVTNFTYMFYGPNNLTRLDLKKWNTQSATGSAFNRMFRDCGKLEYLDVRNFDTSAATTYEAMLCNLNKLTYLNMSNFDSQNVNNFYYFTVNMGSIKEHDFSSLKTSKVTNMAYLFHGSGALEKIYISDLWDTSKVTSNGYMFVGANKLTGEINNHYTMKPRINNLAISDTSTRTIHVGESITIPTVIATYTDNSVVTKNSEDLIWKSSNLDIAKANLGVVKGITPGEVTITIKSGIVETTFNVVVVE